MCLAARYLSNTARAPGSELSTCCTAESAHTLPLQAAGTGWWLQCLTKLPVRAEPDVWTLSTLHSLCCLRHQLPIHALIYLPSLVLATDSGVVGPSCTIKIITLLSNIIYRSIEIINTEHLNTWTVFLWYRYLYLKVKLGYATIMMITIVMKTSCKGERKDSLWSSK